MYNNEMYDNKIKDYATIFAAIRVRRETDKAYTIFQTAISRYAKKIMSAKGDNNAKSFR